MDYHITLDEPIHPKWDCFFEIEVLIDDLGPPTVSRDVKLESHVSLRNPTDADWIRVCRSEGSEWELVRRCDSAVDHIKERYLTKGIYRVQAGSRRCESFYYDMSDDSVPLVSDTFAKRLAQSRLDGIRMVPLDLQGLGRRGTRVHAVHAMGRECWHPLSVRGVPNLCPSCGKSPIVCPHCWACFLFCPKCEEQTYTWEGGVRADVRLPVISPPSKRPAPYIDGHRWDGCDFVYHNGTTPMMIVGRRALNWLLSVHAAPLFAQSIAVDIGRMSKEQLRRLDVISASS